MSSPLYEVGNEVVIKGGLYSAMIGRRGQIADRKKVAVGTWTYDVVLHGDGFYVYDMPENSLMATTCEEVPVEDTGPVCRCDISAGGCTCGRLAWERERQTM